MSIAESSIALPDIEVYLLGTGGPEFTTTRSGIATLLLINGVSFLFDAGRGTAQRIYECGLSFHSIEQIFLTHLHSDHIEGLPSLWITPWFLLGKATPLHICGPVGTRSMTSGMLQMFEKDYRDRATERFKQKSLNVQTQEFEAEGVVYDKDGVSITAFPVDHADGNPAYGYCVRYLNHTVILSGDTTYNENVVKYGKGCDLMIHNVIGVAPKLAEQNAPVIQKLTTPEQAADVFLQTCPHLAVFSHICKKGMHGAVGDSEIMSRVRQHGYTGPLEMGQDRMKIEIWKDHLCSVAPPALDQVKDLQ